MKVRNITVILALAATASTSFASGASTWVGGEAGWKDAPFVSSKTREQVKQEYLAFRANPQTADGGTMVGGEAGYVAPKHGIAWRGGQFVHTDQLAHNTAKPSLQMTDQERRIYNELYVN